MIAHLRRNAVAYVALFVALGSTSYAATVSRNSVGTAQLKRNAVRTADLARNAVTSAKIRNGTIRRQDLAAGLIGAGAGAGSVLPLGAQGPPGPRGADGVPGAPGAQGPPGPTEGDSGDDHPAQTRDGGLDETTFTTSRAGRVYVSRFTSSFSVDCTPNASWSVWLEVDNVRVPGSGVSEIPDLQTLYAVEFSGVTEEALDAGEHNVSLPIACAGASTASIPASTDHGAVTAIVLG